MNSFDVIGREAEIQADSDEEIVRETWYRPQTKNIFGQPSEFEKVTITIASGFPEQCLCGLYREPHPEQGPIENCERCDQGEMFQ
jgi:hypothetical protein